MRKWLQNNWMYLMLVGIIAIGFAYYRSMKILQQRGKYTVGRLGGWVQGIKGGRTFDYYYTAKGHMYRGSAAEERGMDRAKGARYLVEFDSVEPGKSAGYFDYPVPAAYGEAPPGGWNKQAYDARLRADSVRARADSLRNAPAAEAAKQQADAARFEQQIQENK